MRSLVIGLLGALIMLSGCATGPVVGPVSYYTSQGNKRAMIRRSALASENLTAEQKSKVFKLTAHSVDHNKVAVGLGVDVLELMYGDYTTTEVLKQLGGVAADGGIYALIYAAVKELTDDSGGSDKSGDRNASVSISGDNNSVNISNTDTTTTSTNTDNSDNSDRSDNSGNP